MTRSSIDSIFRKAGESTCTRSQRFLQRTTLNGRKQGVPQENLSSIWYLQLVAELRARVIFWPKSANFDGPVAHRVLAHILPYISVNSM